MSGRVLARRPLADCPGFRNSLEEVVSDEGNQLPDRPPIRLSPAIDLTSMSDGNDDDPTIRDVYLVENAVVTDTHASRGGVIAGIVGSRRRSRARARSSASSSRNSRHARGVTNTLEPRRRARRKPASLARLTSAGERCNRQPATSKGRSDLGPRRSCACPSRARYTAPVGGFSQYTRIFGVRSAVCGMAVPYHAKPGG